MTPSSSSRVALRGVAVAIAVVAAIDPAATTLRRGKPVVSVAAGGSPHDSALGDRVGRALEKQFSVINGVFPTADATVLAGDDTPRDIRDLASPLFVVAPVRASVALESVRAPAPTPLDARVPVTVATHTAGMRGRTLNVALSINGVVVDRARRPVAADREETTLSFVPATAGATTLHVAAVIDGTRDTSAADVVVDVRNTRWPVLFYDPRPSWMSTFVRRAVERDPRFAVTSRVVTSRNVSTDARSPPPRLDDLASTSRFSAIVVGAPDALTAADVDGLEQFARRRGGAVVLLFDQPTLGSVGRLARIDAWTTTTTDRPLALVSLSASGSRRDTSLLTTELAAPSVVPPGLEPIARVARVTARDSGDDRVAVWRGPIGAGRVVVSGALDAWRFRDRAQSAFDLFWRSVIADAASASPPAVALEVSRPILAPGEMGSVVVALRDVMLRDPRASAAPVRATVTASMVAADSSRAVTTLRLLPGEAIGELQATFRAPTTPGVYHVLATADAVTAEAPFIVANAVARAAPSDADLLRAWAAARHGAVISESRLGELAPALLRAIKPAARLQTWHPMRSPWWIVPFVLALGGEWLLRRRSGLS